MIDKYIMRKIYILITIFILSIFYMSCMKDDPQYFVKALVTSEEEDDVELEYQLVWSEEFNEERDADGQLPMPGKEWHFEEGGTGWGNDEDQFYVNRLLNEDTVTVIKDGSLKMTAYKLDVPHGGKKYISARMNTQKSWKYGYFEMRAKLPGGRGTWPAFWMLQEGDWSLLAGEIDIMEFVGVEPDIVHFSAHTAAYNHAMGTGKTTNMRVKNATTEFHTYAMEWTEDGLFGYIDGVRYFTFLNDHSGDKEKWPFDVPFYIKLNLAIGGSWGGYEGVDDSIFPVTYEIDYVRVYQKVKKQ